MSYPRHPIRVLHFMNQMHRAGGVENFVMRLYRAIDRSEVQFDFAISEPALCDFEEEIVALGGGSSAVPLRPLGQP